MLSYTSVGSVTQTYIFDHHIFDILGEAELPFQSERNRLCFRQLLRICARVPSLEQRRQTGDLGVTHDCRKYIKYVVDEEFNIALVFSTILGSPLSSKSPVVSHHSRLLRFFYYVITPLH